jgi:signal transduction histidine kinase
MSLILKIFFYHKTRFLFGSLCLGAWSMLHFGCFDFLSSFAIVGFASFVKIGKENPDQGDEQSMDERDEKIRQLESEVLKSKRIQDTIANHFPDGLICVFDRNMNYQYVNGKEVGEMGLNIKNIRGQNIALDFHPALNSYAATELQRAFQGEHIAYEVINNNKAYFVSSTPIYETTNDINEILVIVRNITGRIKLENNLKRAQEKEKEFNILRSRFVTLASHEFRTPLSTILSSVFLLENYRGEDYEQEKKAFIDKIKRAVHSITTLLNDFLSIGKIEEGRVKVVPGEVELKPFFEDILQEVLFVKKVKQNIQFTFDNQGDKLITDKQLLKNIVMNLLSNAIKYSPPDKEIQLAVELRNSNLKVRVTDQGIGIPEDEKSQIFKRFFRGHNVNSIDGTGLGLNIVKKYVRLLKGTVEFTSQMNKGSTFIVVIPEYKDIEN